MPKPPLPPRLDAFLAKPNASVIATVRPDGSPVTVATWYVWEGGRVLVSMDESRKRLEHMRAEPRVSLTVMDLSDWSAHVSLQGSVISIEEDAGLRDIDRIAVHYTGEPYYVRDRRRFSAWIEVEQWHAWREERI